MRRVKAFRVLALGYALLALLIAPAWLAADQHVVPDAADAALEQATTTSADEPPPDPAAERAEEAQEDGGPSAEEPVAAADEADDSAREPDAQPTEPRARDREERSEPVARATQSGSVTITDFEFTPATITVNVGDTVTWTNEGPTVHTATAEDGSFDTGNLNRGESGSATFNEAGTIPYICTPHPFMQGRVVVRAAAAGSPGAGADTTGGGTEGATGGDAAGTGAAGGLPATGAEALMIGLLGLATLAAGMLLRRRTRA